MRLVDPQLKKRVFETTIWVDHANQKAKALPDWLRALVG
jgi:hypothetical protein